VQAPAFDGAHHLIYDPGTRPVPLGLDGLQDAWADLLRPAAKPLPSDLPAGQARVLADDGNSVQVAVHARQRSFLVLDDTYYPGWQVWIDGRRADVHQADYVLRTVPVPAGTHLVEFVYAPLSYLAGLLCTCVTALVVAGAGLFLLRVRYGTRLRSGARTARGILATKGTAH
jgi:hypothetical protein